MLSENSGPLIKFVLAYLDDLLIFLPCIDSYFEHLREVFVRLRKSKMKINPSKCSFLVNKLIFLGNLITSQGIGPDPDKVTAMLQYPASTDQKKLRCVFGLFQFYKKFIPRYSHMVQTFNRLLGKDIEYKWTSVENDAFMELKDGLKNSPFMDYSTADGKFTLITDASKSSTGYLLNQETEDGVHHLIACGGRSFHPAKKIIPSRNWNYYQLLKR